jgi:outer membrane receptor protein involved in Fe transport
MRGIVTEGPVHRSHDRLVHRLGGASGHGRTSRRYFPALRLAGLLLCGAAVACIPLASPALAQSGAAVRSFDIPPGRLRDALELFARQSGAEVLYRIDEVRRVTTAGVRGRHSGDDALRALLRNTGFSFRKDTSGAIAIVRSGAAPERRRFPDGRAPSAGPSILAASRPAREVPHDDIIVTARRTEEAVEDVPTSVTVIDSRMLERNNGTDLSKVAEIAPQMLVGEFGSGTGAILTIRGIGSDAIDFGLDQSVLVVVDNVPISSASIIRQAVFDVRQVEVMPGPQTLFFGKNSIAGVISVSSRDPTDRVSGYLRTGYEVEARERFAEGAISGPLTNRLKARLAFRATGMDGWIRNVARPTASPFEPGIMLPGNVNPSSPHTRQMSVRASLAWEPGDEFDVALKLTVDRQNLLGNGNLANYEAWCGSGASPVTRGVPQFDADCEKNRRVAVSAYPAALAVDFPYARDGVPYRRNEIVLGSLSLRKRTGPLTLTATSGFYDQDHVGSNCADGQFCELFSTIRTKYRLASQELRGEYRASDALTLMAGIYVEHSERRWFTAVDFFHYFNAATSNYLSFSNAADGRYTGYSLFGQLRWNVTPTVELAAGARYSHDRKTATVTNLIVNPLATPPLELDLYPQGQPVKVGLRDDNISPEVTLMWHPTPRQSLYAAYKTGYKAGGVSNPSIFYAYNTPGTLRFGREKASGFELGYKADLPVRGLRLNLSLYRYEVEDLQVISENANLFVFQIGNAGLARSQGVEARANWRPMQALGLEAGLGYNDGKYLRYPGVQCYPGQTAAEGCEGSVQDLSGSRLVRAPELTLHLGADYQVALPGRWRADLSTGGYYTTSYQTSTTANPGGVQPAFWRFNAAVHLTSPGGAYRLSVIGRNLTSAYYLASANNLPLGGEKDFFGSFNRPRELLLQVEYRF